MRINLLVAEHPHVVPVVLDFLGELRKSGFGHDVAPIVVGDATKTYVSLNGADMALIDIEEEERRLLAIAALTMYHIPVIVTSALWNHQNIRDYEGFGFISKPKFDLKKLRQKFEEFAELIVAKEGERAFAI